MLAEPILRLLYGNAFNAAANTLRVLIWTIIPYSFVRYHAYVLVAGHRQRIDLLLNVIMSVFNVLLNLVLIPRYNHLGAAAATLVSLCILALLQYRYLHRHLPGHAAPVVLPLRILAATVLAAGCAWLLRDLYVLIPVALAATVYLATLFFSGFFTSEEIGFLRLDRLLEAGVPRERHR